MGRRTKDRAAGGEWVSTCCGAPLYPGGYGVSRYYLCTDCGNPCDAVKRKPKRRKCAVKQMTDNLDKGATT